MLRIGLDETWYRIRSSVLAADRAEILMTPPGWIAPGLIHGDRHRGGLPAVGRIGPDLGGRMALTPRAGVTNHEVI